MFDAEPEGWDQVTLADCLDDFRNGWTYDTRAVGGALPITRIETISSGDIDYRKVGFAQADHRIEAFRLRKDDILFSHINSVEHIAKVAMKRDDAVLYHGMNLMRLRPNHRVDPEFLFARLRSNETREHFRASCKRAVNQASLNKGEIGSYSFFLPPLDEQRRIAEVLQSADNQITSQEAVVGKLRDLQWATFASFLRSGNACDLAVEVSGWVTGRIEGIESIPPEWKIARLVDVAKLESGHTPSRREPSYWDGGNIGWISLHDTQNLERPEIISSEMMITEDGLRNSSARLLPAGTVCFSRTATVGKCVIMGRSMATSQDFANFVCSEELSNRYLLYLMRWMQPVWKQLASGSTHKTIYMPTFESLQIVLPPRGAQDEIAAAMDALTDAIESGLMTLEQQRRSRTALVEELLSGRVRVPA